MPEEKKTEAPDKSPGKGVMPCNALNVAAVAAAAVIVVAANVWLLFFGWPVS